MPAGFTHASYMNVFESNLFVSGRSNDYSTNLVETYNLNNSTWSNTNYDSTRGQVEGIAFDNLGHAYASNWHDAIHVLPVYSDGSWTYVATPSDYAVNSLSYKNNQLVIKLENNSAPYPYPSYYYTYTNSVWSPISNLSGMSFPAIGRLPFLFTSRYSGGYSNYYTINNGSPWTQITPPAGQTISVLYSTTDGSVYGRADSGQGVYKLDY